MSIRFFCALCREPTNPAKNRVVIEFSLGCICNICFQTCEREFAEQRKTKEVVASPVAEQTKNPASLLSTNIPALQRMISDLLRDMMAKGVKHAQIYRNEKGMFVVYRVQDGWQVAFQQTVSVHLPILHELKRAAGIDSNTVASTEQRGDVTLLTGNERHPFHLLFRISERYGPVVDITH